MPHLVHVTTVPDSLIFVGAQIDFMRSRGWDVSVVTSRGPALDRFARAHDVTAHSVEMARAITPRADLDALARLTDLLLDLNPDIVHGHTPKGGLLAMLAARAARVPTRIYQMRGLLTLTATGRRRDLFRAAEAMTCAASHHVICVSESLRAAAIEQRLVRREKTTVFHRGGNGVDATTRFNPANVDGLDVRTQLGIGEDDLVVGFVGRLVRDKGVVELLTAWQTVRAQLPNAHLLVVGPFESRDGVNAQVRRQLHDDPRIHLVGFVTDTPRYYEALDLLVLPSHREGLPNVPLEAAAMGVPCVTTNAVGCVDAVLDGVTGTIIPVGDAHALAEATLAYLRNATLRAEHGAAARAWMLEDFRPEDRHIACLDLYRKLS